MYCTLYAVCTARQSTLALNCLTYLDNLHLRAIVCTVRSAGQSALAHGAAQIMLSPAQWGKEKANFCSDSLSDARRMFVELVLWCKEIGHSFVIGVTGDGGKIDSWLLAWLNSPGFPGWNGDSGTLQCTASLVNSKTGQDQMETETIGIKSIQSPMSSLQNITGLIRIPRLKWGQWREQDNSKRKQKQKQSNIISAISYM